MRGFAVFLFALLSRIICSLVCVYCGVGSVGNAGPLGVSPISPCSSPLYDCGRPCPPARVAIIGGGITGAATAAFLRTLEKDLAHARDTESGEGDLTDGGKSSGRHFVLDLIEAEGHLGGRLDFADLNGTIVELGGADILRTNEWMVQFHDTLNAHVSQERGTDGVSHGKDSKFVAPIVSPLIPILLHDGDDTTTLSLHTALKGEDGIFTVGRPILHNLIAGWTRLYPHFKSYTCPAHSGKDCLTSGDGLTVPAPPVSGEKRSFLPAFQSAIELLDKVNLAALLEYRVEDALNMFSPTPFVHSIIDALVRGVYTQGTSVHALAGAVTLAAQTGELYEKKLPGRDLVAFLARTHADNVFLGCRIERIEEHANGCNGKCEKTFRLVASDDACPPDAKAYLSTQAYDAVVIATPLEAAALSIFRRNDAGNLELLELPPPRKFQEVFVTIVAAEAIQEEGLLNPTGGPTLTTSRKHSTRKHDISLFSSWCGYDPEADGQNGKPKRLICKLTTERNLTDDDLSHLFRGVQQVIRRRWSAYPVLTPIIRPGKEAGTDSTNRKGSGTNDDPTRFQLMEKIIYPNAFEGMFSCMEGQAMAARNAAHLLWNALA